MSKTQKINVLIVEDSRNSREHLRHLLNPHGELHVLAAVDNTRDAWELIKTGTVQGVFLDINIFGETDRAGMDLAARLQTLARDQQPWLVFVTGYHEHALEAHDYNTLHYLVKPIDSEKVKQALAKIQERQTVPTPQIIPIHFSTAAGRGIKYCPTAEILYLETFHNGSGNVKIKLRDGSALVAQIVLQQWLNDYAPHFLKIHNSRLVNKQYINGYLNKDGKCYATLQHCADELTIGERFLTDFLALFSSS